MKQFGTLDLNNKLLRKKAGAKTCWFARLWWIHPTLGWLSPRTLPWWCPMSGAAGHVGNIGEWPTSDHLFLDCTSCKIQLLDSMSSWAVNNVQLLKARDFILKTNWPGVKCSTLSLCLLSLLKKQKRLMQCFLEMGFHMLTFFFPSLYYHMIYWPYTDHFFARTLPKTVMYTMCVFFMIQVLTSPNKTQTKHTLFARFRILVFPISIMWSVWVESIPEARWLIGSLLDFLKHKMWWKSTWEKKRSRMLCKTFGQSFFGVCGWSQIFFQKTASFGESQGVEMLHLMISYVILIVPLIGGFKIVFRYRF